MGILLVVAFLVVLSALALAGKGLDTRDEGGWPNRTNAGRDPARIGW